MSYLLDTNIISEFRKKQPDNNVLSWIGSVSPELLHISCISIGEIQKGIAKKRLQDLAVAVSLEKWQETLLNKYTDRIIGIDIEVSKCWGELLAIDNTNQIDSLLAAQSLVKDMTLVTRNIKHFKRFGIKLLNPFEEEY